MERYVLPLYVFSTALVITASRIIVGRDVDPYGCNWTQACERWINCLGNQ